MLTTLRFSNNREALISSATFFSSRKSASEYSLASQKTTYSSTPLKNLNINKLFSFNDELQKSRSLRDYIKSLNNFPQDYNTTPVSCITLISNLLLSRAVQITYHTEVVVNHKCFRIFLQLSKRQVSFILPIYSWHK